jgi:small subunit ribosomal protein S3Ae
MMATATKKTKAKAKEWYSIIAPKIFGEIEIGKTMSSDPDKLVGRRIKVSLMELMNDYGKYYVKFIFRIQKVEGTKALTDFDGSEIMQDYISRMIFRRVRRIDTVQDLQTKDGFKIRVKGLAIISRRIKSSIMGKIRNQIREMVKEEVENSNFEDFVDQIISDELKGKILRAARQTYPVRNFEIRKTEIL